MTKSKSMTVAAAALAMCMAGSAFAQDRRDDRWPGNDGRYTQQRQQGQQQQPQRHDGPGDYRGGRQDYRPAAPYAPYYRQAYPQPHADWRRGGYVPGPYRGQTYVVNDWRAQRLNQPPRGYQWVGVGGEFALAAIATGLIAQIIVNQ